MSAFYVAAVIFGIGMAIKNVGASRVFWAVFGYQLGKRRNKR